ncbi:hypothetical protein [Neisseria subflava]|uniref:hypothetical protein n=1 Tax=Neisseria subflava TaxID=28449 RepID=UPI003D80A5E1
MITPQIYADKIAEAQTEATLQEAQTTYRCLAQTELPFQSACVTRPRVIRGPNSRRTPAANTNSAAI